jgi:transketolase C-terminal domain/subunit/transketolase N-terminal domain/subunit
MSTAFPIPLMRYEPLSFSADEPALTPEQQATLARNIDLCRSAIVFFTALSAAKGWSGHTGGAYDTVPEVVLLDALFRGDPDAFVPVFFDEAGHRVATQYLFAALHGHLPAKALMTYREPGSRLPGHPERREEDGIFFSSGRLGHLWPYVNGIALANPGKAVFCLGSDGSQQGGNDAEAARHAVGLGLGIKLLIDNNDSTCSGAPSRYLKLDVARTLHGHGLPVLRGPGEDIANAFQRLCAAVKTPGPVALINDRPMAPGIPEVEGTPRGHDALEPKLAMRYLEARGYDEAVRMLADAVPAERVYSFPPGLPSAKTRRTFGATVVRLLGEMSAQERRERVLCIDSDLGESCGLGLIEQTYPEVFRMGGIMERANFSAAAGFGHAPGRQGIFGTYAAFLEMCLSEIFMARLNRANVLCNLSHAGVDDLVDNTCHFGLNLLFADNGLAEGDTTRLYYPADAGQMRACVERIFTGPGLRFIFSSRSPVPEMRSEAGTPLFGDGYRFEPGRDDLIRAGSAGYLVSFGEMLYRCLNVVDRLRAEGIDLGLVNKPTLNVPDEAMLETVGRAPFVLVVEALNRKTGLGSRYGSWLLERGLTPAYGHLGSARAGIGGEAEQIPHQGLDEAGIEARVRALLAAAA